MPNEKQTPDEDESTSEKKVDKYLGSGLSEAEIARRRKLDTWCPEIEDGSGFSVVGAKRPSTTPEPDKTEQRPPRRTIDERLAWLKAHGSTCTNDSDDDDGETLTIIGARSPSSNPATSPKSPADAKKE